MDVPRMSQPVILALDRGRDPTERQPLPDLRPPRLLARVSTLPLFADDPDIGRGYKLTRTYSETETNNFDADTGHRLFDDGRIRAKPSRTVSPTRPRDSDDKPKLYLRSHDEYIDNDFSALVGLEDEYIPGLDFSDVLQHWTRTGSEVSTPVSREGLYLDLNKLHAKVAPQPIQFRKYAFDKPVDNTPKSHRDDPLKKKPRCSPTIVDPVTGEVNFSAVLASLPLNFSDLPYSQRKKMVKSFSESIDYTQFSNFAKSHLGERSSVSLGRTNRSDNGSIAQNGSFIRRSRRNSANTVAGRLLALSLSSDLKKLDKAPKVNVDEKGALVLGHELGKIIGFGAWGTIRECVGKDGTIRAVKIVRSTRENERTGKVHNPKVLQVFRKEIDIWNQLHHESILPLLDHVETEDTIFCLTNRIGGGTLFEVVSRWGDFNEGVDSTGAFTFLVDVQKSRLQTTIHFARQIVLALLYMHQELGIVHGDLKLENVLVDDLDPSNVRVILCDFGMSRVYAPRISRKLSRLLDESTLMGRSKSSAVPTRKPYHGPETHNTRFLFADDLKIGILHLLRSHGPSLQSVDLTPIASHASLSDFHEFKSKDNHLGGEIESDLPHLHIGLLPYASPELLNPLPPPLGPSADIWAFGVLVYTMVVGRLPFQHPYEPRLRAIITAGKFSRRTLRQACLMEWLLDDDSSKTSSMVDMTRRQQIEELKRKWEAHNAAEFEWLESIIEGCLERDITKRWDLDLIAQELGEHHLVQGGLAAAEI